MFNKAVQIGRTVINFSVKSISQSRHFGPRPQEGLIKEKELNPILNPKHVKMIDEQEMENDDDNNRDNCDPQNHIDQPFDMVMEQDNVNMNQEENRNEDIPNEIPDNRKTRGGGGFNQ